MDTGNLFCIQWWSLCANSARKFFHIHSQNTINTHNAKQQ